jgi:probable rRNA maturation factor
VTARAIRRPTGGRAKPGRAVTIDIAEQSGDWPALGDAAAICRGAALAALDAAATPGDVELSIVLGDDALLRELNRRWRGKDAPTNVLSFPAQDFAAPLPLPPPGAALPLGDVVLAYGTLAREAAEQGKSLSDHLAHLVVHGVLHLVGYDHEAAAEAERMEGLERAVLSGIGIADPYRESGGDGDDRTGAAHG